MLRKRVAVLLAVAGAVLALVPAANAARGGPPSTNRSGSLIVAHYD